MDGTSDRVLDHMQQKPSYQKMIKIIFNINVKDCLKAI